MTAIGPDILEQTRSTYSQRCFLSLPLNGSGMAVLRPCCMESFVAVCKPLNLLVAGSINLQYENSS